MLGFFAHVFCIQEMVKQCKRRGCVGICVWGYYIYFGPGDYLKGGYLQILT